MQEMLSLPTKPHYCKSDIEHLKHLQLKKVNPSTLPGFNVSFDQQALHNTPSFFPALIDFY